ncbi:MAK10-like protein [Tanacetum coccineum]
MWLLSRYKARLVANGITQLEGVDIGETFSSVVKPGSIGTVLSLATSRHWPVHQLDVKNAFLHGDLSETVYMHQPSRFRDSVHPDYGTDTAYFIGNENHIRTLGDYSKPSHKGYRNTIELPIGNNVVPLRSDTIRLVQNECSFHGLWSEDRNQHLKDFLKLVDSLDLDGENRERTRFFLHDKAWLERLPAGSITTWEDLTTQSLSEAWTRFKDLLQKVPHHGIDLWLQVQIFYDHVTPVTRRTIDQSAGGKLRDRNAKESWALLEDIALYDNESWNDPRDFAKPVKAISLPQDVPSTSDCHLIELKNQVQLLMEAHLAPMQPTQVNKITTSCEICSGPHDTQYCMEDLEQAFVEYASSRTDEAGGKWYTFKPEQNNFGDTYNPSWKSHPNLKWRQPQNSQNNFSNPPNRFQPNGSIPNHSFNNNPQNFNSQSNLEGLVSNFMAFQDARLSKFEADFKQQQSEMTNKIDTVLKVIPDRIAGALPSDTVKNPKLSTYLVLSTRSYPTVDLQCSSHPSTSINAIKTCSKEANISQTSQLQPEMGSGTQ